MKYSFNWVNEIYQQNNTNKISHMNSNLVISMFKGSAQTPTEWGVVAM